VNSATTCRLGYTRGDVDRLHQKTGGASLATPRDLCGVIDKYEYADDWRAEYRVQSVRSSLKSSHITCIDGAILAYGLLELLFPETKRRLLSIHRRDPRTGEECGHCVALYWDEGGRVGSVSKSNLQGLGHRDPLFSSESVLASDYAKAYLAMGFEPLYFGVTTLEEAAPDLDWRFSDSPLNELSERLQATYEFGFEIRRKQKA